MWPRPEEFLLFNKCGRQKNFQAMGTFLVCAHTCFPPEQTLFIHFLSSRQKSRSGCQKGKKALSPSVYCGRLGWRREKQKRFATFFLIRAHKRKGSRRRNPEKQTKAGWLATATRIFSFTALFWGNIFIGLRTQETKFCKVKTPLEIASL